jgi:hypothetical protein
MEASKASGVEELEPPFASPPFERHVQQRTVVLPRLRVLFVPIPKAGCTTVLWLLARLARISAEAFARSGTSEVSPALTVHDTNVWTGHRLADCEGEERERALTEEGWLRFAVVRDPGTRLWSAWQSKLLLREPRFLETFGDEPWFPRLPERPEDLVEDFRRFVAALPGGGVEDVHWAVQHQLAEQVPLTHVGRVERLADTLDLLQAQVGEANWPAEGPPENRSHLPMPPSAYDDAAAEVLRTRYAADFNHYGYEPSLPSAADAATEDWERRVAFLLPLLRDTIERHARIGQLHEVVERRGRRVQAVEEKLESVASRQVGRTKAPVLTNLEGHTEFNVRWTWSEGDQHPGFTAVVRVKNEAQSLPWVLPPLLRAVSHVVVIDNQSTDGTADVARRAAAEEGAADRLEVHSYPFAVARCGPEHLGTPAESVHSLAYFYNWSFSHVRTAYALKWDGDMVLTETAVKALRDLAWQLEASQVVVKIPRYPLYLADDRHAFLDLGLTNCEPWAWPNRPGYSFVKAMEWELPMWPLDLRSLTLPTWSCIELKHLDADEFAHWSHTDFDATRTQRKRREWEVFHALADGGEPPANVVPMEAPDGVHVIEYVRSTWMPERANEPAPLDERILQKLVG